MPMRFGTTGDNVRDFLARHPQVRTALRVFIYTFLAAFSATFFSFLNDIAEWASGEDIPFPDISIVGRAALAAVVSSISAAAAVIWNAFGFTKSAVYVNPPAGDVDPIAVVEPVDPNR
jgi:hypothetical protein